METFSALLALCEGNPSVTGGFPSQGPVMRSFAVFFDLRLNKQMSKQSRRWWFETPLRPLWRYCYELSTNGVHNGTCRPTGIDGDAILVSCHVVKSLQHIWRFDSRRWNLRVSDLAIIWQIMKGYQGPFLLKWINFNPSMEKSPHAHAVKGGMTLFITV